MAAIRVVTRGVLRVALAPATGLLEEVKTAVGGGAAIGYQKVMQWCSGLPEKTVHALTSKKIFSWALLKPGMCLFVPAGFFIAMVPLNNEVSSGLRQPYIFSTAGEQKAMLALFEADGKPEASIKMLKFALAQTSG